MASNKVRRAHGLDLGGSTIMSRGVMDSFQNLAHGGKKQSISDWQSEMKADKARRRGTVGVYNPKTGTRDYGRGGSTM